MTAKPGLPECVRSNAGLGLALAAPLRVREWAFAPPMLIMQFHLLFKAKAGLLFEPENVLKLFLGLDVLDAPLTVHLPIVLCKRDLILGSSIWKSANLQEHLSQEGGSEGGQQIINVSALGRCLFSAVEIVFDGYCPSPISDLHGFDCGDANRLNGFQNVLTPRREGCGFLQVVPRLTAEQLFESCLQSVAMFDTVF